MKTRTSVAVLVFVVPALISAWGATGVFNAILVGLNPQINPGYQTLPIFCMIFFGLTAIAAPLIVLLSNRSGS